ncbi:MAG: 2-amino-4-hydroxy-6-hydroxymethyldihydropteridine diphosphokinase [Deltaproteobacteria bacterium]|nr:2-amino-4-hydroxy-6-hydroxymethyldihydropteridine diphosphokinase [Deltaproteobacteria bacterium]MBI4795330.1 2-amino-4-hydroxy-6-hydroxymethyldihydropteridine diphosphokinase [Deltaproteobacteria bacterium]
MPLGPAAITELKPVIAYVGLGANLGDPRRQLEEALARLAAIEEVEVLKVSRFYRNPPLGPPDQPWYVNAVAQVRTRLEPEELLRVLLRVEEDLGRVRGERWGPRIIDLDLLLYDGVIMSGPELVLPHPEMHRRAFVLVPLAEIAPQAWHPVLEKTVAELLMDVDEAARAMVQPASD